MNNDLHEKIEAYFEGTLSEKDSIEFEYELKTNEEIQHAYNDYITIRKTAEHLVEEDLKKEMKSWSTDLTKSSFNKYWILATIVSALIIITITSYVKMRKINDESIIKQFAIHETILDIRSDQAPKDSLFLTEYIQPMKKAQSAMENHQFENMRKQLSKITLNSKIALDNKEWMIGLSHYLENGRKDPEFHRILNKILDDVNHENYSLAVSMDKKVNGFWGRLKPDK